MKVDMHFGNPAILCCRVGENVKPMSKAKLTTHKGVVGDLFSGCHVSLFTTRSNEISASIIADKVGDVILIIN